MAKVALVGALAESLTNFRGDLISTMVAAGHDVVAMAAETDNATRSSIRSLGATFRPYPVRRNGLSAWEDLETFRALRLAFGDINPDVVIAYTIKPVIWGGLASRSLRAAPRFVALITGLGMAFRRGGVRQALLRPLVVRLYRSALVGASRVIFQNRDNCTTFVQERIVEQRLCAVVDGSGVDLTKFGRMTLPGDGCTFLLIARILGDKGVREFAQAARIVRETHPQAKFRLVGPLDPSPDGIPSHELMALVSKAGVEYMGPVDDVRPWLGSCNVYVLPSYHEGMPRSILEAMAAGRPIITTDVPGCRETVVDGDNGFLIPARDARRLAWAMTRFLDDPGLADVMGARSREIAEARFDVRRVTPHLLSAAGL